MVVYFFIPQKYLWLCIWAWLLFILNQNKLDNCKVIQRYWIIRPKKWCLSAKSFFWNRYGHILWYGCLFIFTKKSAMVVNLGMVVYLLLWIPVPWSLICPWSSIWHLRVRMRKGGRGVCVVFVTSAFVLPAVCFHVWSPCRIVRVNIICML